MSIWSLTEIDRKILLIMAKGGTNYEIANELHYNVTYIDKKFITKLYKKLGVDYLPPSCKRTAAVAIALRKNFIE
jgi:DNA-binding NarL/FixJ family response regulator